MDMEIWNMETEQDKIAKTAFEFFEFKDYKAQVFSDNTANFDSTMECLRLAITWMK